MGKSRLQQLLDSAPPHRLADLFGAAFEERYDRRLALLSAACPKARLRLARALLEEVVAASDGAGGAARPLDARSAQRAQRNLLLQQQLSALRKELAAAAGAAGRAPREGDAPAADAEEDDELGGARASASMKAATAARSAARRRAPGAQARAARPPRVCTGECASVMRLR